MLPSLLSQLHEESFAATRLISTWGHASNEPHDRWVNLRTWWEKKNASWIYEAIHKLQIRYSIYILQQSKTKKEITKIAEEEDIILSEYAAYCRSIEAVKVSSADCGTSWIDNFASSGVLNMVMRQSSWAFICEDN